MKELEIKRLGFKQYQCTNRNGKVLVASTSSTIHNAIKECLMEKFHLCVKFSGYGSFVPKELAECIEILGTADMKSKAFAINEKNNQSRPTFIKAGDYIAMDVQKEVYIARVEFQEVKRQIITMKF